MLRFRLYDVQADEVRLLVNWQDVGTARRRAGQDVEQYPLEVTIPASLAERRRAAT